MKRNFANLFLNLLFLFTLTKAALDFGSLTSARDLSITGEASGEKLGSTMASGDINGDGFDDIIIGAPKKISDTGAVSVIYGGPLATLSSLDLSGIALHPTGIGFNIVGNAAGDLFGSSICTGDIDGDGYDDMIIGAYMKNGGKGAVYVIYGADKEDLSDLNLLVTPLNPLTNGFVIVGNAAGDNLGFSVSTGDVDKDGYDDIIIGAKGKNINQGYVYVIFGGERVDMADVDLSSGLNSNAGFTIIGGAQVDSFGQSVCTGDVNGDNYDDIVIGAHFQNNGAGSAYVIYGKERTAFLNVLNVNTMTSSIGFRVAGEYNSRAGYSVATAKVNEDEFADIIISVPNVNTVYVIYGKSSFTGTFLLGFTLLNPGSTGLTITGGTGWSGAVVNNAGDINQDGREDIIIGLPYKNSYQGAAYVVYGGDMSALTDVDFSMTPSVSKGFAVLGNPASQFGTSVCVGDINDDGFSDVMVGAPTENTDTGAAYVLFYNVCANNCEKCTVPSTCDECSAGYGVEASLCVSCPQNCEKCGSTSISTCDLCSVSYVLNLDTGICGLLCPSETVAINRVCERCPDDCSDCNSGTDCTLCHTGFFLYQGGCEAPCPSKTFESGMTCKDCPSNCIACGSETVCDVCDTDFVKLNGVCESDCPIKMFDNGGTCQNCLNYCDSCSSATDCDGCSAPYLNNQGECVGDCPVGRFEDNGVCQGCISHCSTCSNSTVCEVCSSPFLFYHGQCMENCPVKTFKLNNACHDCRAECSECANEATCQSCIDGYTLNEEHLCEKTIEEKDDEKAAAGVFEGTSLIGASLGSGSSLPLNFGLVAKILRNFKYMDIPASHDLRRTFVSWKVASGFMSAPKSWNKKYNSKELPEVFRRYELQSAFLVNFWKPFSMALVGMAIFGIFKGIEVFVNKRNEKKSKLYSISKQIHVAASNFALTQFYSNLDDVIFYFIVEARSMIFDTGFRVFSLIFAVVIFMAGGLLVGLHVKFVNKYQSMKGEKISPQLEAFVAKSENVNLIFKDFKDTTHFTQSFLLINVLRSTISSLIFAVFYQHPVIQIFMLFVLNMAMLAYLLTKKPFKEIVNTCGQIFCEVVLLIANISVFILVLFDQSDSFPVDSIERLSKCIIVLNFILLIGCALLMLINIGKGLYDSYQEKKKTKAKDSDIFTSAKFSRSAKLPQSDQTLGDLAVTDLTKNEFSRTNANAENIEMSSSNIIFQLNNSEFLAETNLFSNNNLPSSQQFGRIKQDFKLEDNNNSSDASPEIKIQDHSKMVLNEDVSLTNFDETVGEISPPLKADPQNVILRRKIRRNEDKVFRGIVGK